MDKLFNVKIGCIADDFTGASDAASFLKQGGLVTVLCDGIPNRLDGFEKSEAVVIALKTRSVAKEDAVKESLNALEFLKKIRVKTFYFKYCSTFDSTPSGNIGPVCDAIIAELGVKFTLLCPSLPVNKRTVKNGHLYVDGIPLNESHMKNHPLNPMWDSSIPNLMAPQSKYPCLVVDAGLVNDKNAITEKLSSYATEHEHFYVVPDYVTDKDGELIAAAFKDCKFITGGSGLLEHIARLVPDSGKAKEVFPSGTKGRAIALCGSCSVATKGQIADFKANGGKYFTVDPDKLLSGTQSVEEIWDFIESEKDKEVLVYSIGAEIPIKKTGNPKLDAEKSSVIEKTMATLGKLAYDNKFTRIIVGGGETSGAVTQTIGFNSFFIGESIAPGVPIMAPTAAPNIRIALKSGNFGQSDFFRRAFSMTKE